MTSTVLLNCPIKAEIRTVDSQSDLTIMIIIIIIMITIIIIIIIMITCLTTVNPSAEAVINGCPGQLKINN